MDEEKVIAARREFLKMAAIGALGSMALPGCSDSNADSSPPTRTITIIGMVDIAQALADNSLNNNVYWLDNNAALGSKYLGTDHLRTAINRGNLVQWVVSGLQVETVVDIASITGAALEISNAVATPIAPGISFWTGQIVPTAIGAYQYGVALKVESRVMTMSSLLTLDVQ